MEVDWTFLFENHPDPMWVYDKDTDRFLNVNNAAITKYGYSRDEFLSLGIDALRPPEDLAALTQTIEQAGTGLDETDIGRHQLKSGEVIHVEIRSHTLDYCGRKAEWVSARDVSRFVALQQEKNALLVRERELRQQAEKMAYHFKTFFETAPGKFLVLHPDNYEIVAVSDAYLKATFTNREEITGRSVFEVFPDDPSDLPSDGTRNLKASLERVKASGTADIMAVQRYPIPLPEERGGGFEERYWSPVNSPVKDPDGRIAFIIHRVEDVTEFVQFAEARLSHPGVTLSFKDQLMRQEADILAQSKALKEMNERLLHQQVLLRNAQRLIDMGSWEINLDTGTLRWSENIYSIFGVSANDFGHTFEAFFRLVHPDDREMLYQQISEAMDTHSHYDLTHRIVRPDGSISIVREAAEVAETSMGRVLVGVVQDITEQHADKIKMQDAMKLLRLAGKTAKLGGWRVNMGDDHVIWSEQTAAIHEMPASYSPTIAQAIDFYAPECHERIRTVFSACVEYGRSFDEMLQIVTAKGRQVWVRAIGEAERNEKGEICAAYGAFQDISELVTAREQSESMTRRLQETLNSISDAFFLLDRNWRFSFINQEFERIIGKNRESLIGKNVWQSFPEVTGYAFQRKYEYALETGKPVAFIEYYAPLQVWLSVKAYPTAEGLAVYFQDITQEREQQERLRLLETAVSRQNDILLITEAEPIDAPEGPKIVYVNEAFVRRTGYQFEEVIGKTPRILQGAKTQPLELARIRRALEAWQPVRAELINYTKAGEEFWIELDIVPIADDKGWYTHWVSVERDITERKQAEEVARLSNERFKLIARATNDVIWDWNLVTNKVWWNDNYQNLFGYSPGPTAPGPESWTDHIHPADRERVVKGIHAVIEGKDVNWHDEYRYLCANGEVITVIDRGFVIRDETGKAVRMLGSMVDVTELRALDERLRQAQRLEAVGQLTGGIAHDFNNLLTVILGNVELLKESLAEDSSLQPLVEITSTAAERGAALTNRLLAFARRQALDPKVVDINKLVRGMDGLLRRALTENIDIEIVQSSGLWRTEVDPGQLETAILNLAINARDAMPQGGELTIETANIFLDEMYTHRYGDVTPGEYVMLTISDTGTGMSPEVAARAFDPFFTTKSAGKGSGLGLSMVFGFIKQSGGHISIYTEEGEGSTFKLFLPRAAITEPVFEHTDKKLEMVGGTEHILVVEDDELVREHLIAQLKSLGYRISSATNGPEALEKLKQSFDIDLLFTDIVMPGGMNGRELADEAHQLHPALKVLFTSGYTEDAIIHQGRLDRGIHLLSKPYRRQDLAAKLRVVLHNG